MQLLFQLFIIVHLYAIQVLHAVLENMNLIRGRDSCKMKLIRLLGAFDMLKFPTHLMEPKIIANQLDIILLPSSSMHFINH